MTTRQTRNWPLLATALAALLLTLPALTARADKAHSGHGKVTAVSATSITVTPKNGDAKTFTITDATTITLDDQPVKAADDASLMGHNAHVKSDDGTTALGITATTHHHKPAPAPNACTRDPADSCPRAGPVVARREVQGRAGQAPREYARRLSNVGKRRAIFVVGACLVLFLVMRQLCIRCREVWPGMAAGKDQPDGGCKNTRRPPSLQGD